MEYLDQKFWKGAVQRKKLEGKQMKFWRRIQKGQFEGDIWSGNFEGTTRNGKREGKIWKRTLGSEFGTVNRNQPKEPLRSTFPNIKFGRQRSEVKCRRAYSEVKILLGNFEEQVRKGKVAQKNLDGGFPKRELGKKTVFQILQEGSFLILQKDPSRIPACVDTGRVLLQMSKGKVLKPILLEF